MWAALVPVLAAGAALLAVTAAPLGAQEAGVHAIRGGTVHTMAGETIEGGTVVMRDGRIVAVGAEITAPADAEVVDATGLHVYPGLFSAFSQLGLQEINAVAATNDIRELGDFNPQLVAATAVHPASERIPVTRAEGVTHVVSAPSTGAGGIAGRASVIHLDGWTVEEMLVDTAVGMVLSWPSMQTRRFDFSTFSVVTRPFSEVQEEYEDALDRLKGWLEDARRYRRARQSDSPPTRDLKLEALGAVVSGALPFLVLADEARDIRNAVGFMEEEDVPMILVGGRDAWKVTDLLTAHDVPVLLRATQNLPSHRDAPYDETFTTPARLHDAGVRFAITAYQSSGPNPPSRTLAQEAANAVPFGLPWQEAVRAITRDPAEILGLGDRLGTIEPGKVGNVIVTDGDPLQIRTRVLHVFIGGVPRSTDNKHRELYERYRARQ